MTRASAVSVWKYITSFGPNDLLVEMTVSHEARRKDPSLPAKFTVRAVGYKHPRSKGEQRVLSSLCDPVTAPAKELIALYRERWEREVGFNEIKTHLLEREETIRSREPEAGRGPAGNLGHTYDLQSDSIRDGRNCSRGQPPFTENKFRYSHALHLRRMAVVCRGIFPSNSKEAQTYAAKDPAISIAASKIPATIRAGRQTQDEQLPQKILRS